jgi:hypothetical protein
MMALASEKVMTHYAEAYQKLYNRIPKDLRVIDNEWVVVNGARMRVTELEYLTKQLQQEYSQGLVQKKTLVMKLVKWLKG